MATSTPAKRKPAAKKKSPAKKQTLTKKIQKAGEPEHKGVVGQMASLAGRMLDVGATTVSVAKTLKSATVVAKALREGSPIEAAGEVVRAVRPANENDQRAWAKTGAALKGLREAAGLTIEEVGHAINLKDPAVMEELEKGMIALPFEIILRLAAVLGRNDPIGFVMEFTRTSNPEIWKLLEALGIGKLLVHGAREREFVNIYRGNDAARKLTDEEFTEIVAFTKSAFELAMAFHKKQRTK